MRLQLSPALLAALTLIPGPGLQPARADDGAPWKLAQDDLLYSDTDNVRVLTSQVAVSRDLDEDGSTASARGLVDVVSAASVDVISHATTRFQEARVEGDLGLSYALGSDILPDASYRISREPDYDSQSFGGGLTLRLGGADSVLSGHYTATLDTVGRTDTPRSLFGESLTTHSGEVGLTQNLGRRSLLRGVYTLTVQRGYMEKPYRFVPMFTRSGLAQASADGVHLGLDTFGRYSLSMRPAEEVPHLRVRHALGGRYLHYVEPIGAALRADYRFYIDDWLVVANTAELSLYQPIGEHFRLDTFARGYVQTGASFWERTYVTNGVDVPRYRTLDRKLSPYWALTLGARGELVYDRLSLYLELNATETHFMDSLLIENRAALVSQLGVEYRP